MRPTIPVAPVAEFPVGSLDVREVAVGSLDALGTADPARVVADAGVLTPTLRAVPDASHRRPDHRGGVT